MNSQAMKLLRQRRMMVLVALMIALALLLVNRSLRRTDPQLYGNWIETHGNQSQPSTTVAFISTGEPAAWIFNSDGTGSGFGHRYAGQHSWWTQNGYLYIDYNWTRRQWRLSQYMPRVFKQCYDQPQLYEFEYVVVDKNTVRLKLTGDDLDTGWVIHLTRMEGRRGP